MNLRWKNLVVQTDTLELQIPIYRLSFKAFKIRLTLIVLGYIYPETRCTSLPEITQPASKYVKGDNSYNSVT